MRSAVILALLLASCNAQPAVQFADLDITLPEDTGAFPAGAGSEAMTANCGACHSPSMILTQPKLTRDRWKANIKKMREVYKAPIEVAAEPEILAYLERVSAAVR